MNAAHSLLNPNTDQEIFVIQKSFLPVRKGFIAFEWPQKLIVLMIRVGWSLPKIKFVLGGPFRKQKSGF